MRAATVADFRGYVFITCAILTAAALPLVLADRARRGPRLPRGPGAEPDRRDVFRHAAG
jgi:hypothetical protein